MNNLVFRKAEFSDCIKFNDWENDDKVIKFLSIEKYRSLEVTTREFFIREYEDNSFDFMVLVSGIPVGRVYLSKYDQVSKSIDITRIYIGEERFRSKGIGYQIMKKILKFCFEELELNRVSLDYYDGNPAQKLYEKCGFKSEGVLREAFYKDGNFYNYNLMSILRKEWDSNIKR